MNMQVRVGSIAERKDAGAAVIRIRSGDETAEIERGADSKPGDMAGEVCRVIDLQGSIVVDERDGLTRRIATQLQRRVAIDRDGSCSANVVGDEDGAAERFD